MAGVLTRVLAHRTERDPESPHRFIDNWSEFGGPRDEFMANTANITSRLRVIEEDFRSVDYASLGKFNVYLFDGPHAEEDHRDGIVCALPALAERLLLIVDDWNWLDIRLGTMRGLISSQLKIEAAIEIRTTMDDTHPRYTEHRAIGITDISWRSSTAIALRFIKVPGPQIRK